MSLRIQNNIAAMNTQRNLGISDSNMSKSLERLSSGYRINSAKDDASGLAQSMVLRANIASAKVAQRNIAQANAGLQSAEGAMSTVGDILTRMKELATQASSTIGADYAKIDAEFDNLKTEIDRIATANESAAGTYQIGYTSTTGASQITVAVGGFSTASLSLTSAAVDSAANALTAMTSIDSAISSLATARAGVGSNQNRLAYAASNLAVTLENMTATDSVIRDVDMAEEMTNFTKNQILVQAGTSMLAQANMAPQQVLALFK
ncbi:MAG: flagellin [Syntrophales bacterium]